MTTLAPRPVRARPPAARAWWRDAAGVLCWATALVVVFLWLIGGGARDLGRSAGEALISTGRLTGLIAADLLLIQVFLMARVPPIERSYGQDELARRHRLVGFWSFNLLLGHIVLISLGYGLADHRSFFTELIHLVLTYPGMWLAAAATAALVAVVVSSVRVARRKLRYESWHLLHLYAYVGVGFSIPHEIWTGADFTSSPLARTYWWTSYGLAGGAVIVYRLGVPAWRSWRHALRVSEVVHEGPGVITVRMSGQRLDRLPVSSGQFFIWRFLDGTGWSRGHPYSLSRPPGADHLQITVKDLGDASGRLRHLRVGGRVLIEGPYGRLSPERAQTGKIVMMASGIGITPMRALLEEMSYAPGAATLIYRARSTTDLIFEDELESLAQARGIALRFIVGSRNTERTSWLPARHGNRSDAAALADLVPDIADSDVYICGPQKWMEAAAKAALHCGVPTQRIHQETFGW